MAVIPYFFVTSKLRAMFFSLNIACMEFDSIPTLAFECSYLCLIKKNLYSRARLHFLTIHGIFVSRLSPPQLQLSRNIRAPAIFVLSIVPICLQVSRQPFLHVTRSYISEFLANALSCVSRSILRSHIGSLWYEVQSRGKVPHNFVFLCLLTEFDLPKCLPASSMAVCGKNQRSPLPNSEQRSSRRSVI